MIEGKSCRFCNINSGDYKFLGVDEPVSENGDFYAIASIGAFIEGWTLIVPKAHQLSMQHCYHNPQLTDLIRNVSARLVEQYGPVIAFEHGANLEGSSTSCGTNHAHLHLVPLERSLLPEMNGSGLSWKHCKPSEIADIANGAEYLFYVEPSDECEWDNYEGFLHILERPISQYFRQLLATQLSCAEKSDYRHFPFIKSAMKTRIALLDARI